MRYHHEFPQPRKPQLSPPKGLLKRCLYRGPIDFSLEIQSTKCAPKKAAAPKRCFLQSPAANGHFRGRRPTGNSFSERLCQRIRKSGASALRAVTDIRVIFQQSCPIRKVEKFRARAEAGRAAISVPCSSIGPILPRWPGQLGPKACGAVPSIERRSNHRI
jgi:hypothetical protein